MATKEAKSASGASAEVKQRSGTLKSEHGGFDRGTFGYSRFGEKSGYVTTKEAKVAESSTKEAKT